MEYTGELKGALSQCAPCRRTFLNLTAFDKHQDVDYGRQPSVICMDPADVGLVQDDKGLWGTPEGHTRRKFDAEQLNARRATTKRTGQ